EAEAEERKRLNRRSAADDHLGTAARQEIDRREVLERAHRVFRAEDGHGARQPNLSRSNGCRAEDDRRRRIEKLPAMVLADAEHVESDFVGVLDLLDELAQPLRRVDRAAVLVERRGKAVNAYLHSSHSERRTDP